MEFEIPKPLKAEHEELHSTLVQATREPGPTGAAAQAVAALLHPHFVKEEEYALPPLGLLPSLAKGHVTPDMASVLPMTDKLKAHLDEMLAEHKSIVGALDHLADVAKREGKSEYAEFAEKLILHAQSEEQVSYPTTILIGEYIKLKLRN
ncbi:MAG: hemerythrin domain-containing protein [Betaproteobacteria bacterium]|nr:hemerythrin domain-containing protein [Betaproteobacteria bacterium]